MLLWVMNMGFAGGPVVPTVPGLEYTLPDNRLHYTLDDNKLHFTMPDNRLHFTLPEED